MMMELCRHALSRSRESAGSIPAKGKVAGISGNVDMDLF